MKSRIKDRITSGTHAVLDVGTSKIVCFIASIDSTGTISVQGIGHQLSRGIRSSSITDFSEAETSIMAAVHAAEQMASTNIDNVHVSISGHGLHSRTVTVEMSLMGEEVIDRDILDIIEQGRQNLETPDDEIIHCIPTAYAIDGVRGIVDPRHMFGKELSADLHVITAPASMVRNLSHCIGRCHLNVAEFIAAPHASALACLEEDEMELGVTLIDIGGGNTSFSVFQHGKNIFSDMIPVGGSHVTSDIAKGLSTTISHAERLKTLHGSCIASSSDDQVIISAPLLGEDVDGDEGNTMPRSMLVGIIRPRMEEIFEMIKGQLDMSGVEQYAGRRVVLTGGGSQLIGARELAARMLGKQVRLGRPRPIAGLAEAASGPAFATALGMLRHLTNKSFEERLFEESQAKGSVWQRVKGMFGLVKEGF
jgi:cell division protein FtsA